MVVRPPNAVTGILLARADGAEQAAVLSGSRSPAASGFFLRVDDFEATYRRMAEAGVEFLGAPRSEVYGKVVVFRDIAGNKWDSAREPGPTPAFSASAVARISNPDPVRSR